MYDSRTLLRLTASIGIDVMYDSRGFGMTVQNAENDIAWLGISIFSCRSTHESIIQGKIALTGALPLEAVGVLD